MERPVSYIRRNFFYGRDFASDDDLNIRVLRCLDSEANIRIHGILKERPVDRYETERPHLKPLARWPYRPVGLRLTEPGQRQAEAAVFPPIIEVERRPLAEYARMTGAAQ